MLLLLRLGHLSGIYPGMVARWSRRAILFSKELAVICLEHGMGTVSDSAMDIPAYFGNATQFDYDF